MNLKNHRIMNTTMSLVWMMILSTAMIARSANSPIDDYTHSLKTYVTDWGMVDYEGLKSNSQGLNTYLDYIATLPEETLEALSDADKIAFWINTYNSLILKVIIDHYPIKSSFFRSLTYPKNSIQQIPGVWNKLKFTVLNRPMTLKYIQQDILLTQYKDPRILMGLACASQGCPFLRNEPYTGSTLNEQLNDQSEKFLENRDNFKIDRADGVVYLSPFFKWNAHYFTPSVSRGKLDKKLSAVINFIAIHVEALFKPYLYRGKFEVKYLKYDWSLNEQ